MSREPERGSEGAGERGSGFGVPDPGPRTPDPGTRTPPLIPKSEIRNPKSKKVYLVGAGPGEAKLITLKGVECLQQADVVIYDRLANVRLLAYCRSDVERIYGGKLLGEREARQSEINAVMVERAKAGKTVVRLKGGDPFVFGHGGEEAFVLREAGIPYEIVPGVTSAIAAPAYAGIPLTQRGYSSAFAVVTGHSAALAPDSPVRWDALAAIDTLVVLMGVTNLRTLTERLMAHGRPPETPTALVRWGTTPRQETLEGTLADIAAKAEATKFESPATIVVGQVAALREQLRWYEDKPLFGRAILVTRPLEQADALVDALEAYGADVWVCPTIEIRPNPDHTALDMAIEKLATYDWVVFTSVNAVDCFQRRLHALGKDARAFGNAKICAVGPKTTAALNQRNLNPDYVPSQSHGGAIADELAEVAGKSILLPRARIADDGLPTGLRARGALVDEIAVYDTVNIRHENAEAVAEALRNHSIDMVTFLSASAVSGFLQVFGAEALSGVHVAVIGQSTAEAVQSCGVEVSVVASQASVTHLAKDIVQFYAHRAEGDKA